MVETVAESRPIFTVPDEGNRHRTLNIAAPYGRRRRTRKDAPIKSLMPSDAELGDEKLVVSQRAHPAEHVKRIEQAGVHYRAFTVKYAKLAEQMELGALAHFEEEIPDKKKEGSKKSGSSEDDEEDKEGADAEGRKDEMDAKRKKKTK